MDAPEDIYSTKILEVVAAMPQLGCFEGADGSASKSSKLCGSKIEVCLNVEDGKISKYGQTVEACLLGQAAASVMAAWASSRLCDGSKRNWPNKRGCCKHKG